MSEDRALRQGDEKTYFMQRAAQERSAAAQATGEQAREAHAELAKRYRRLVKAGGQAETAMSSSRT